MFGVEACTHEVRMRMTKCQEWKSEVLDLCLTKNEILFTVIAPDASTHSVHFFVFFFH